MKKIILMVLFLWENLTTYKEAQADGIFIPPPGVQLHYDTNLLLTNSYKSCYDQPYSSVTTGTSFLKCNGTYIFVGAKLTSSTSIVELGAFGNMNIFNKTSSTKVGTEINGVYWYFYPKYAFGFSPTPPINLNRGDILLSDCNQRLSWHLDVDFTGGYRAGCNVSLYSSVWRKVVYTSPYYTTSKPSGYPTSAPVPVPTLAPSILTRKPTISVIHEIHPPTILPTIKLNVTKFTDESRQIPMESIAQGVGIGVAVLFICLSSSVVYNIYERKKKVKEIQHSDDKTASRRDTLENIYTSQKSNLNDLYDSKSDLDFEL